ncbi:MAG: hypothetical protein ACKVI3_20830 [Verrucomicrobiia bacterium]
MFIEPNLTANPPQGIRQASSHHHIFMRITQENSFAGITHREVAKPLGQPSSFNTKGQ